MRSRSSCAARTGQRRRGVDNYHAARGTVAAAPARRCGRSVRDKFSLPGAAGTVTHHTGPGQVQTARRVQDKWRRRQRIIALPPHARRVPGRRARAGRMRHVLAVRSHRPCAARPRLRPPRPARRHPNHRRQPLRNDLDPFPAISLYAGHPPWCSHSLCAGPASGGRGGGVVQQAWRCWGSSRCRRVGAPRCSRTRCQHACNSVAQASIKMRGASLYTA